MKNKESKEVRIKGDRLQCPVCEGKQFWKRRTLLNTPGVTFFGFDWLNKTAENYICDTCNYMYWFYEE